MRGLVKSVNSRHTMHICWWLTNAITLEFLLQLLKLWSAAFRFHSYCLKWDIHIRYPYKLWDIHISSHDVFLLLKNRVTESLHVYVSMCSKTYCIVEVRQPIVSDETSRKAYCPAGHIHTSSNDSNVIRAIIKTYKMLRNHWRGCIWFFLV